MLIIDLYCINCLGTLNPFDEIKRVNILLWYRIIRFVINKMVNLENFKIIPHLFLVLLAINFFQLCANPEKYLYTTNIHSYSLLPTHIPMKLNGIYTHILFAFAPLSLRKSSFIWLLNKIHKIYNEIYSISLLSRWVCIYNIVKIQLFLTSIFQYKCRIQ